MKRIVQGLTILAIFCLSFAIPKQAVLAQSVQPTFFLYTDANCRSGPGIWYQRVSGIYAGTTVPIIARADNPATWWEVNNQGVACWVLATLGYASGDLSTLPEFSTPPMWHHGWGWQNQLVRVKFTNDTGGSVCRIDLIQNGVVVVSFPWDKGHFPDGSTRRVWVTEGRYDRLKAYNCKPKVVVSTPNVQLDEDTEFTLNP